MNPMMRTLLGELTQVRGHVLLVLPSGVELPDRPSDSELNLWKGRSRCPQPLEGEQERHSVQAVLDLPWAEVLSTPVGGQSAGGSGVSQGC